MPAMSPGEVWASRRGSRVRRRIVISLLEARRRREVFLSQAAAAGFEVFEAVDARGLDENELAEQFDTVAARSRYGRPLVGGEVGCTLSHVAVWRQIVGDATLAESDAVIVCEDDARFTPGFVAVLEEAAPARFDLVVLSRDLHREAWARRRYAPSRWTSPWGCSGVMIGIMWPNVRSGTLAYLVTKRAARVLVAAAVQRPSWLADDYVFYRDLGLVVGLVRESLAAASDDVSGIGDAGRWVSADPGAQPRHEEFEHDRYRRRAVWFALEELRSRTPRVLRGARTLCLMRIVDDWLNGIRA